MRFRELKSDKVRFTGTEFFLNSVNYEKTFCYTLVLSYFLCLLNDLFLNFDLCLWKSCCFQSNTLLFALYLKLVYNVTEAILFHLTYFSDYKAHLKSFIFLKNRKCAL